MDTDDMRLLASFVVDEMEKRHSADLAPKWLHGRVVFKPGHPELKQHELPIERFLHKIVMMRDNLRVLEQQINGNKVLTDGDKVKLQSYITRIYGSMTSFNFMFEHDDDMFRGSSKDD